MPWRRRHDGLRFGRFFEEWVEDGQSDGSVPDVGSSETDSEHTEEQHELHMRALHCGYYRPMSQAHACPNDSSAQRYRCRLCKVICCKEFCLARQNGVCRHCREAWPIVGRCFTTVGLPAYMGSSGSSGSAVDRIGNSLRPHSRQRSRSRSPASNLVGSCTICHERPKNHCLVPCGHRVCLQCGLRCLPICPQCRGTCTLCIRVWD